MTVQQVPTHTRLGQKRFYKGGKLTLWADAPFPQPLALGSKPAPIVPIVSSGVPGPLGLNHLPRIWLEGILEATGRIAPGFAGGRPLFDEVLCGTIRLDRTALHAFVRTAPLPDYLGCEAWVEEHATRLDPWAIVQVNNAIGKAQEHGQPLVLADDLRAWRAAADALLASRPGPMEPVVPAISSRTAGPLGVDHVPRMWFKNILKIAGALPIGYRSGRVRMMTRGMAHVPNGLDAKTCRVIGLDEYASIAFLDSAIPDYPAYERWVAENARKLDVASVTWHNALRENTRHPKATMEKIYAQWDNETDWSYVIDDLIDWRLIYDTVVGNPLPAWAKI